jgi:hypothetical protein
LALEVELVQELDEALWIGQPEKRSLHSSSGDRWKNDRNKPRIPSRDSFGMTWLVTAKRS